MFGFFTHGWCHFPVIPTVYSDALSYEEDLGHVKCVLHKTIEELKNFEDFVRASFEELPTIYLKIDDAAEKYLTKADAEATYTTFDYVADHYLPKGGEYNYITEQQADAKYLQIADAQADYLTKADAQATYLPTQTAESDYLKITDAQTEYLSKLAAAQTYLTQANAGLTYLDKTDAQMLYLSKKDAQDTYLTQTGAAGTYLTQQDAQSTYLTQSSALATYLAKTEAASTYFTIADANTKFGDIDTELHTLDIRMETAEDDIVNLGNLLTAAGVIYVDSENGDDTKDGTSWDNAIKTGNQLLNLMQELRYQQIRRVYVRGSIIMDTAFRFRDIVFTASRGYDCKVELKQLDHYGHIYLEGVADEIDRSELILNGNAIEGTLHVKYGTLVCNNEIVIVNGSLYLEYGIQTGNIASVASNIYTYNSNLETVKIRSGVYYANESQAGGHQINRLEVMNGNVYLNTHVLTLVGYVPVVLYRDAVVDTVLWNSNLSVTVPTYAYFDFGSF